MRARRHLGFWRLAIAAFLIAAATAACADDPDPFEEPVILVATDNLIDPTYWHTVLVARPTGEGRHVGVILNRPTDTSMARLFPEHAASRKVQENVFFGGPMAPELLSAAVRDEPGLRDGVINFGSKLHLVLEVDVIDAIIEQHPNEARYYMGKVFWRPNELRQEMARNLWYVLPMSDEIVFRKDVDSLWNELNATASMLSARLAVPRDGMALAGR